MYKTIMITGGTGYVGSWVVKELLEHGYTLRVCVRNKNNSGKFRHLEEIAGKTTGKIEIWEADLLKSGSFDDAARGSDAIFHLASPFTLRFRDPKKELLDPALLGTRNVLAAASLSGTVKKVVLTSSVVAVHGDNIDMKELGIKEFTEENFNFSSTLDHQPYSYSKVVAEKEAWEIFKAQRKWNLVVINPSFVMGPPLSKDTGSESLSFMKDLLVGRYRAGAPDLMFGYVDVRDIAIAHRLALENDSAEGRYIVSATVMSTIKLAEMIKNRYGTKFKLPLMKTPKFMVYLVGWMYGLSLKFISRNIEHPIRFNNTKSIAGLGMVYRSIETTIAEMVDQMTAMKMV